MDYVTECPECGGPLELAYAEVQVTGVRIEVDGFCLSDAKIMDTRNEEARCVDCRELFTLYGEKAPTSP